MARGCCAPGELGAPAVVPSVEWLPTAHHMRPSGQHSGRGGGILTRRWSTRVRTGEHPSRRQRAQQLLAVVAVVVTALAALHKAFGLSSQASLLLGLGLSYCVFNELIRLGDLRERNSQLSNKVRQLLESRRTAGLKRLGAEVSSRPHSWPRPPYSYTVLAHDRFNTERCTPLKGREVDYKSLACDAVSRLVGIATRGEGVDSAFASATALSTWLLQRLMHEGPSPEKDPDLFKELHAVVDVAEKRTADKGFFCRLCLGYHTNASKTPKVRLDCGKCFCGRCAKELVGGALEGRIGVPIACPIGDCKSVLSPSLVKHIVQGDDFDRFQRMHTVKMSLDKSAPHKEGLASKLADAMAIAKASGMGNGTLPPVQEAVSSSEGSPQKSRTSSRHSSPLPSITSDRRDQEELDPLTCSLNSAVRGLGAGGRFMSKRDSAGVQSASCSTTTSGSQGRGPRSPPSLGTPPPTVSAPRRSVRMFGSASGLASLLPPSITSDPASKRHHD